MNSGKCNRVWNEPLRIILSTTQWVENFFKSFVDFLAIFCWLFSYFLRFFLARKIIWMQWSAENDDFYFFDEYIMISCSFIYKKSIFSCWKLQKNFFWQSKMRHKRTFHEGWNEWAGWFLSWKSWSSQLFWPIQMWKTKWMQKLKWSSWMHPSWILCVNWFVCGYLLTSRRKLAKNIRFCQSKSWCFVKIYDMHKMQRLKRLTPFSNHKSINAYLWFGLNQYLRKDIGR